MTQDTNTDGQTNLADFIEIVNDPRKFEEMLREDQQADDEKRKDTSNDTE